MELPTRYIGFDEAIARAEARLPADLRSYLEGHAAGVNARSAQLRQSWESSTDPHIQYMVQRGLHLRQGKVRDAIAAFTKLTADFAIGAYNTWADNISRIAPIQVEASLYKPFKKSFYFTASNELGVSGRVTASGRPMIVLDPHMPTHTDFWNRNMSVVIRTPGLILDGAIGPGNALPTVAHAMHPETGTAMGFAGTANAITTVNVWFAETQPNLSQYKSYKTQGQFQPFQVEQRGDLTIRTGSHGRLMGYHANRGLGFMMRQSKDGLFTMIEGLWAVFHSKNPNEFLAALDLQAVPFWNIMAGFSTPTEPSRILYIDNQVSAVRDPDPNGDPAVFTDWNDFLPAMSAVHDWTDAYHPAAELPQREIASTVLTDPTFMHCHNCSPEQVTGQLVTRPYLQGGYWDVWNHRQMKGEFKYSQAFAPGQQVTMESLKAVVNDKDDVQLTDIVFKLQATFAEYGNTLDVSTRLAAQQELAIWTSGPIDGSPSNTRVGRVLYWQSLMKPFVSSVGIDLPRLVHDLILPNTRYLFNANAPLPAVEAGFALQVLAQVGLTYDGLFGGPNRPWSDTQFIRPGFGVYPVPGTPNGLMSISGAITQYQGRSIFEVFGGQNYVQIMEIGWGSLLRRSVQGTYDDTLPYAHRFTELYSQETFVPTGIRPEDLTSERILTTETVTLRLPQ